MLSNRLANRPSVFGIRPMIFPLCDRRQPTKVPYKTSAVEVCGRQQVQGGSYDAANCTDVANIQGRPDDSPNQPPPVLSKTSLRDQDTVPAEVISDPISAVWTSAQKNGSIGSAFIAPSHFQPPTPHGVWRRGNSPAKCRGFSNS